MKLSAAAERYLTWLRVQPTATAADIVQALARAEALAVERKSEYVTSKHLAEVWREIGRRRAAAGKQRTK